MILRHEIGWVLLVKAALLLLIWWAFFSEPVGEVDWSARLGDTSSAVAPEPTNLEVMR